MQSHTRNAQARSLRGTGEKRNDAENEIANMEKKTHALNRTQFLG